MNKEEMLSQLESIREHCNDMIPKDEPDSVWRFDADALDMAISALRQQETVTNRNGLNEPLTLDELRKMPKGE